MISFFKKIFSPPKDYKVKFKPGSQILYIEKGEWGREAAIDMERLFDDQDFVIYFESLKYWLPPNDDKLISDEERQRIKSDIDKDLKERNFDFEWE